MARLNKIELKYRSLFGRAIQQQIFPVLKTIKQGAELAIQQVDILVSKDPIEKVFIQLYREIGFSESWKYRQMLTRQKAIPENWKLYFDEFILPVMLRRTASKVVQITKTTKKLLKNSIAYGIEQGFGIDKIADLVREDMVNATAARARTIAQTEVIGAANTSAYAGAESAGVQYRKYWSNSGLEGIRESHIEAHNDSYSRGGIEPHERFTNGLLHPGDPEGPPEEIINCRCTLIVEPV